MRESLRDGYIKTFGELPKYGAHLVEPAEEPIAQFERHGLASFYLPLSNSPEVFIFDLSLFPGAKFAWIKRMQAENIDILISNGQQSPNTRRARTTPNRAKQRSIEFNSNTTEGLSLITRYSFWRSRMPPYSAELFAIPCSE